MSQHDYDIAAADANTGTTFRAAVNSALQAMASCSLGLTAPTTAYPGQLWADTTTGWLKMRNSATTEWHKIWQLNSLVSVGSGGGANITNVAVGRSTLAANTTGGSCVAIGDSALLLNTYGSTNSAVGSGALAGNIHGDYNVAVGGSSLAQNTTGDNNTAVGTRAFYNLLDSSNAVAIGTDAGRWYGGSSSLTYAPMCIYIGAYTLASANNVSNEIAIGYGVTGSGTNTVTLGNANITKTVLRGRVLLPTPNIATSAPPASATATGTAGDVAYDSSYVYICVATNTWKRAALSTW